MGLIYGKKIDGNIVGIIMLVMKKNALRKRRARGSKRLGLKIGKRAIKAMDDLDFYNLIARVKNYSFNRLSCLGQQKQYKRVRRLISLIRNEDKPLLFFYRDAKLLSSFYPSRKKDWLPFIKRKKEELIDLNSFSFLDRPLETIENLKRIVKGETFACHIRINFNDDVCLDIAPYVLLSLMRPHMTSIFAGGRMSPSIAGAINAVNLKKPLMIGRMPAPAADMHVFPFTLKSRRNTASSSRDNLPDAPTTEEKVSQDFVSTLNEWLGQLTRPFSLTDFGKRNVHHMILEMLDNAKRHSDMEKKDGQWHMAGLMQGPFLGDQVSQKKIYVCNLTIVSLGNTIYESLQSAPEDKLSEIKTYVDRHKSKELTEEVLWNVAAIQDGISRCAPTPENPSNGYGFGTALTSFFGLLSSAKDIDFQPVMSIVSGRSCITVKDPYNIKESKDGYRTIAFNAANSLEEPPDRGYVQYLPMEFPGTLITIRFFIDDEHLADLVEKNDTN